MKLKSKQPEESKASLPSISPPALDAIHALARHCHRQSDFSRATDLYRILTIADPFEKDYWLGLGKAQQDLEDFSSAIKAYASACLLELENPTPHFHAAECYLSLGKFQDAAKALRAAENFGKLQKQEHQWILQQAALMRRVWGKKLELKDKYHGQQHRKTITR
ncbi:MAG: hypothetical protein CMO81_08085 [Waddliaceae bacterium]|nr:hypothetical protein [Waddliaceae bacterium]